MAVIVGLPIGKNGDAGWDVGLSTGPRIELDAVLP